MYTRLELETDANELIIMVDKLKKKIPKFTNKEFDTLNIDIKAGFRTGMNAIKEYVEDTNDKETNKTERKPD